MAGEEVEIGGFRVARFGVQALRPLGQSRGVLAQKSMQRQRWQRELIHHVRFVALTKVADVFMVRHIGFVIRRVPGITSSRIVRHTLMMLCACGMWMERVPTSFQM